MNPFGSILTTSQYLALHFPRQRHLSVRLPPTWWYPASLTCLRNFQLAACFGIPHLLFCPALPCHNPELPTPVARGVCWSAIPQSSISKSRFFPTSSLHLINLHGLLQIPQTSLLAIGLHQPPIPFFRIHNCFLSQHLGRLLQFLKA